MLNYKQLKLLILKGFNYVNGYLFSNQSGFTLIELCISAVLIGVLAQVGAVTLRGLSPRLQLDTSAKQVTWDLMKARTRAISYKTPITFTVVNNHTYTIWTDSNDNEIVDEGEEKTKVLRGKSKGVRFIKRRRWQRDVGLDESFYPSFVFQPQGIARKQARFTVYNGSKARTITVYVSGKVKMH